MIYLIWIFQSDNNNNVKTTCVDTHDFNANGGKFTYFEYRVTTERPFQLWHS